MICSLAKHAADAKKSTIGLYKKFYATTSDSTNKSVKTNLNRKAESIDKSLNKNQNGIFTPIFPEIQWRIMMLAVQLLFLMTWLQTMQAVTTLG
jgi:hypothetical protein